MNATGAAVAELSGLRVVVGGRAIVDGVSLRLTAGRVTALVGASGSGKTTTGLALLGEYPAGAEVTGTVRAPEGLVGYVPQHPAAVLNPVRRCGALLFDIARAHVRELPRGERARAAAERVAAALEAAQLPEGPELLRRFPHQLSGGQQQRLVLAQALLLGARVVIADEPTTGQDALTKRRVVGELAAVARRGIAVLLLSHDADVVNALADEVVELRAGRVVASGPAARTPAARHEPPPRRPPAARPLLRVTALTARHGRHIVLRDAELTLADGEFLAVLGRSGSGKTTLARCLAGLHRHHSGEVLLDGTALPRSLRDRSRSQLAAVQYVFQDASAAFDEHRPVAGQVARTAVRLRGLRPAAALEEARAALARTGLSEEVAGRRPGKLSGGELQRAALARALLARPRVLVCDEITSGLDAGTRAAVLGLLTAPPGERDVPAVVFVTHDLAAAAHADRAIVLDGGRIVERGAARDVLTVPRHPFTAELVKSPDGAARSARNPDRPG
ncbi:ABC transporter ATP-binding protein [Streptomyces litchfieldiae]|uniref:ATP-binding cassette domain-containing protein n=1 Tax=Streptomyces litchfieldiae TaxID=3075543 RepID=A0ABU2N0H9_9ACTN|nr:ATP-binding cassette domain-containing protein [Streptomyces sp. DSM 44938]MDT0346269.1 ATP-binding cassette domain-containing protein [Streptomyces sp. DSM 44938]